MATGHPTTSPTRRTRTDVVSSHPEIAVLVSSYNKPDHLRRVLVSLAVQEGVDGRFEVVVTDDGSTEPCRDVVTRFASEAPFDVRWVTHPHDGFQLARCRNEGVAASRADYLLFLDGDCVVPPDHLRRHLELRQAGWVMGGYCCRLSEKLSDRITEGAIREQAYLPWIPGEELRKLRKRHRKAVLYSLIGHRSRPKLAGGNIAISRRDYERVNGYDENFVGWGCEDDDLRRRLATAGLRIGSVLHRTRTYHLWHPQDPAAAKKYRERPNANYANRPGRLIRCRHGLVKRDLADIAMQVVERPADAPTTAWLSEYLPHLVAGPPAETAAAEKPPAEVEIVFAHTNARFSGRADCNIWVNLGRPVRGRPLATSRKADLVLADQPLPRFIPGETQFTTRDSARLIAAIC